MSETSEQKVQGLVDKASRILDSAGVGISQRPTAWTAITIVVAFCTAWVLTIWFLAPKLAGILSVMCGGGVSR